MILLLAGLLGAAIGFLTARIKKRPLGDQFHRAAVIGLLFLLGALIIDISAGWMIS